MFHQIVSNVYYLDVVQSADECIVDMECRRNLKFHMRIIFLLVCEHVECYSSRRPGGEGGVAGEMAARDVRASQYRRVRLYGREDCHQPDPAAQLQWSGHHCPHQAETGGKQHGSRNRFRHYSMHVCYIWYWGSLLKL